jgi:tetratricopeptide (TPR) repeat protein
VLYDSILRAKKKQLHGKIGEAIVAVYHERLDQQYGVLCEHFLAAEDYEKGAKYSRLASRNEEKVASFKNSIAYTERTIACLEKLPPNKDLELQLIDERTKLGLYHLQLNHHVAAKDAVEPVINLARKHGYDRRLSQIYSIIGSWEPDLTKALSCLDDALEIATNLDDPLSLVMAYYWKGLKLVYSCEFDKAIYYWQTALEININTNTMYGVSVIQSIMGFWIYGLQGKVSRSYELSSGALRISDEFGDIYSKLFAHTEYGKCRYCGGDFGTAVTYLLSGLELSQKMDQFLYSSIASWFLACLYLDSGEHEKSLEYAEMASAFVRNIGPNDGSTDLDTLVRFYDIVSYRSKVWCGDTNIDLDSIFRWCDHAERTKSKLYEAWMTPCIAEILLQLGCRYYSESEQWIRKSIDLHERAGMVWDLGKDHTLYADWFKHKADNSRSQEQLAKAIEIFTECGADGWVKRTEEKLAQL